MNKQELRTYISNNNIGSTLVVILSYFPKNSIINFLNDRDIIDILSLENLDPIYNSEMGKGYISQWNLSEEEYERTYLYEKLRNTFTTLN